MPAGFPGPSCLRCAQTTNDEGADFCSDDCEASYRDSFLKEFADQPNAAIRFWRQYVLLQEGFLELLQSVELTRENLATHSDKLLEFTRSCGSEVDSLCKTLMPGDPDNRTNMSDWRLHLEDTYELSSVSFQVPRLADYIRPFRSFASGKAPDWWDTYHALKHRRATNFEKASLGLALNALAGLLVLNLIKIREFIDYWANRRGSPQPFDERISDDLERVFYLRGTGISRNERGARDLDVRIIPRSRPIVPP